MTEIWKDIDGYIGYYKVSNLGNVRSVDRIVSHWKGGEQLRKCKLLKQADDGNCYKFVCLQKNGKRKIYKVHRLVAEAFIPNPNNYQCVNHIDEDKHNNCVDNLEWCTQKYNCNYGTRTERGAKARINHPSFSRPILQFTLDGKFIKEYPSAREAERHTGISFVSISACCIGKKLKDGRGYYYTRKSAGGFLWRFKD